MFNMEKRYRNKIIIIIIIIYFSFISLAELLTDAFTCFQACCSDCSNKEKMLVPTKKRC